MLLLLDKIRSEIKQERVGYPPSADYYKAITKCLQIIDKAESEMEMPADLGRWITHPISGHLVCNRCLSTAPYDCHMNYCPNCGLKMVKEVKK